MTRHTLVNRLQAAFKLRGLKYILVGCINTTVGFSVIVLSKAVLGWGDISANAAGYASGFFVSFSLNSRWTFDVARPSIDHFIKYLLVILIGYGLNVLVLTAAIQGFEMNGYPAQLLSIMAFTLFVYVASAKLAFKSKT